MKISGIMPLRNAVKLDYPYELAIRSMRPLCDELVVLVDPTSEDNTLARVEALGPDVIVESRWDMHNHDGMNDEIAKQTAIAMQRATGDWIMSLQADELLHEDEIDKIKAALATADRHKFTAFELQRWYFFGSLNQYRDNWTCWLPRLVKRDEWIPDPKSGAMFFIPIDPANAERKARIGAGIFHYSRVGDPQLIARRVRNLDLFYHAPERVANESEIAPYSFEMRKLDTYVRGHEAEADENARLVMFPLNKHPKMALEHFNVHPADPTRPEMPMRECAGNQGQACPDCSVPLKCLNDYVGGGSHYWHLLCPTCDDHFTYDTYAFSLRRWPQVSVELYCARDGLADFVVRNKSTREAVLQYAAVKARAGSQSLRLTCDAIGQELRIPSKGSRGEIFFCPQNMPDGAVELTFDFWEALRVEGESVGPSSIRVSCSDLKRKTCPLP